MQESGELINRVTEAGSGSYVNKFATDSSDHWNASGVKDASYEKLFTGNGYAVLHEYSFKSIVNYSGSAPIAEPDGKNGYRTDQGTDTWEQSELYSANSAGTLTLEWVNGVAQSPVATGFSQSTHNGDASRSGNEQYYEEWTRAPNSTQTEHYIKHHNSNYALEDHLRVTIDSTAASGSSSPIVQWGEGYEYNDLLATLETKTYYPTGSGSGSGGGGGLMSASTQILEYSNGGHPSNLPDPYYFGAAGAYSALPGLPADWSDLEQEQPPYIFNGGWENYFTNPLELESLITTNADAVQQSVEFSSQHNYSNKKSYAQESYEEDLERKKQAEAERQAGTQSAASDPSFMGLFGQELSNQLSLENTGTRFKSLFWDSPGTAIYGLWSLGVAGAQTGFWAIGHPQEAAGNVAETVGTVVTNVWSDPSIAVDLGNEIVMQGFSALDQALSTPEGQGSIGFEIFTFLLPPLKGASLAGKAGSTGGFFSRLISRVTRSADDIAEGAAKKLDNLPNKPISPKIADTTPFHTAQTLGGGCFVAGTPVWIMDELGAESTDATWQMARGSSEPHAVSVAHHPRLTVDIEAVPLGVRVPTKNPNRNDYDFRFGEVVQAEWSRLVIAVQRNDGAQITLELLRPNWLIREESIPVGSQFHLSVAELDVEGTGTLLECGPCPAIAEGDGAVVTGRFVTREVLEIVHLTMEDGTELAGTPVHPIWSVDRSDWVRMDELQSGEHLQTNFGPMPIADTQRIIAPQSVYNLEIAGEHVYEVTDLGILVHNANPLCEELKKLLAKKEAGETIDEARLAKLQKMLAAPRKVLSGDEFEEFVRNAERGTKGRVKFNPTGDVDVDSISDTFLTQIKRVLDFSKWPPDRLPRGLTDQLDKTLAAAIRDGKKLRIVFAVPPPQKYLDMLRAKYPGIVIDIVPLP